MNSLLYCSRCRIWKEVKEVFVHGGGALENAVLLAHKKALVVRRRSFMLLYVNWVA